MALVTGLTEAWKNAKQDIAEAQKHHSQEVLRQEHERAQLPSWRPSHGVYVE